MDAPPVVFLALQGIQACSLLLCLQFALCIMLAFQQQINIWLSLELCDVHPPENSACKQHEPAVWKAAIMSLARFKKELLLAPASCPDLLGVVHV